MLQFLTRTAIEMNIHPTATMFEFVNTMEMNVFFFFFLNVSLFRVHACSFIHSAVPSERGLVAVHALITPCNSEIGGYRPHQAGTELWKLLSRSGIPFLSF